MGTSAIACYLGLGDPLRELAPLPAKWVGAPTGEHILKLVSESSKSVGSTK